MIKCIVFFSMFFSFLTNAQETDFGTLLSLFSESRNEIPEALALKYFDFQSTERAHAILTGEIISKTDNYIILSTIIECNTGGSCEQSLLTSFSNIGERIDRIAYERSIADCSFDDRRTSVFISNNLLVFEETRAKLDCLGDGKQTGKKAWLEFQPIGKNGSFLKPYTDFKANQREHYIFSHRVFTKEELTNKTTEELDVIKNEIFAAHGYMFTKKKWQDYFESKTWYVPSDVDAVNKLTDIERKNVAVILSMKE